MALITFLSDFGNCDHYVAAVKAKIYGVDSNIKTLDISHGIARFNIAHGSFVLKSVFRSFPEGTVHLVAVNSGYQVQPKFIALEVENHYFVGPDNGLLSLISDSQGSKVVKLPEAENNGHGYFPERDTMGLAAAQLAAGKKLEEIGEPYEQMKRMINKQVRATRQKISGSVIHVDHYGNLITNIEYRDFEILSKNKKYKINYGRTFADEIHAYQASVVQGESFHIFNSLGLLEIGINMGNGSELLGLEYDSPVHIIFED
ncbi:SAM-dependent chlorinase/fluorinase [Fulvivirgaceae bacterium BMA12]|uniref:SAM-dependent chlorinase/fluorinase n=1 Tax=Agaribacillus aureus TaxID=3051825 RepID=A0ABT8L0U3_9BACT|nr:SAM-dependent chlorinase/fluorinase [Fulvivirgaceae bacterium BMA12]